MSRRLLLRAAATLPVLAIVPRAEAKDYASAAEVLDAIDGLEAQVEAGLAAIATRIPAARDLSRSVLNSHQRRRAERAGLRRRLRVAASGGGGAGAPPSTLEALREAQQALVHAHAEGLPALDDVAAVDLLARHMVDAARHLTVIDLWLELEAQRAG